jgi:arylsulfatase A-like enzyme
MKVLVIEARGLQPAYLGCYGSLWVETPTFDRLAAEGVVFDQHYADCPGATPRSSWTGRYQFPVPPNRDGPDLETPNLLGSLLRAHGVAARRVKDARRPGLSEANKSLRLERTIRAVIRSLKRMEAEPNGLVWVDLTTLMPPWDIPSECLQHYFSDDSDGDAALTPWTDPPAGPLDREDDQAFSRLQNTYAAAVTALDAQLGILLDQLENAGSLEETLIWLTADRGLALGEHGTIGAYRPWLYEEVLHLPSIIRWPGGAEPGLRLAALTQPVDLLPTLLDLFGLPVPEVHGFSLLPLVRGEKEAVHPYACAGLQIGGAIEWALRSPDWAFLLPVRPEESDPPRASQLYAKPDDRWEVNNVRQHHLELAEHFEQVLHGFVAAARRPGPLEAPALGNLEAVTTAVGPPNPGETPS